jgi:hypothetical protein
VPKWRDSWLPSKPSHPVPLWRAGRLDSITHQTCLIGWWLRPLIGQPPRCGQPGISWGMLAAAPAISLGQRSHRPSLEGGGGYPAHCCGAHPAPPGFQDSCCSRPARCQCVLCSHTKSGLESEGLQKASSMPSTAWWHTPARFP